MPAWGPRAPQVRVLSPRRLDDQIHRCVIEIYDARLVLRQYLDDEVGERARRRGQAQGLGQDDLEAVMEATKIKAVLLAKPAGTIPGRPERPASRNTEPDEAWEVEQLARVARAFVDPPVVAAVVNAGPSAASKSTAPA